MSEQITDKRKVWAARWFNNFRANSIMEKIDGIKKASAGLLKSVFKIPKNDTK